MMKNRLIIFIITFITLLSIQINVMAEETKPKVTNKQFIYTYDEMLEFDVKKYLSKTYPDLVSHTNTITHWSSLTTVSPQVFIALLVLQNSENDIYGGMENPDKPFGSLSTKSTFESQTEDIGEFLSQHYYEAKASGKSEYSADTALIKLLTTQPPTSQTLSRMTSPLKKSTNKIQKFKKYFNKLFQSKAQPSPLLKRATVQGDTLELQLPYPMGEAWFFGGTHSNESSIDFAKRNVVGWGTEITSDTEVSASHEGIVFNPSTCSVEVISANREWSTIYYHLDNITVSTGEGIAANDFIANYADTQAQALCEGGSSNGPHLHFALKKAGELVSLNGKSLSGYQVHAGRGDYDTHPDFFWLASNNTRHYAFVEPLYNPGIDSSFTPTPTTSTPIATSNNPVLPSPEIINTTSSSTLNPNNGDTIHDVTPTFTWNGTPNTTIYAIEAFDNKGTKVIWNAVSSQQANCASAENVCAYSFSTLSLPNGAIRWRVRAESPSRGTWSDQASFFIDSSAPNTQVTTNTPPVVTPVNTNLNSDLNSSNDNQAESQPINPNNNQTVNSTTPTLTWTATQGATMYAIKAVTEDGSRIIWNAVTPAQAGCSSGTRSCSYSFSYLPFPNGTAAWQVIVESPQRLKWSELASFVVSDLNQ